MSVTQTASGEIPNPYQFLDYFGSEDRDRFAGRERDLRELEARVTTQTTSVLYARSGLGKTSLILAGLFPRLEEAGYRTVYMRARISPWLELVNAVEESLGITSGGDVTAALARASEEGPVLVVLDQFEEFFIKFAIDSTERREFFEGLAALLEDESISLRLLVSLREDYLANLGDFREGLQRAWKRGEIPDFFRTDFRLEPLTAFGSRQAITQPLIADRIPYDPRLVGRLVDLLAKERFDPVLLQIVCTEVFNEAQQAERDTLELRLADLTGLEEDDGDGGESAETTADTTSRGQEILDEVLRRYLDRAIEDLDPELHLVARTVLDTLVTHENTKRRVTFEDFEKSELISARTELETVLGFLEKHRLLRREQRSQGELFELRHDRLVDTVQDWIERDPDFFDFREARNQFVNLRRQRKHWRKNPELLLTRGAIEGIVGKARFRDRLVLDRTQLLMTARSCVYRLEEGLEIEHFEHWVGELRRREGDEAVTRLAAEGLDSPHTQFLLGAARAIEILELRDGELSRRLVELALVGEPAEVRRAAGKTLARVAEGQELDPMRQALLDPDRQRRQRARELLADLEGHGARFDAASWLDRWRARRLHKRRQLDLHRDFIDDRGSTGVVSGAVASLAWSSTLGAFFIVGLLWVWGPHFWSWNEDPQGWGAMALQLVGLSLLLAPVGALLGSAVARCSARAAILSGRESWGCIVLSAPSAYVAVFLLATVQIGFFVERSPSNLSDWAQPMGVVVALTFLATWALAFLVGGVQRTIPSLRGRWLWLVVASLTFPIVVFVAVHESLHVLWQGMLWDVLDAVFVTPSDWIRGFDSEGIPQFEPHIFTIVLSTGTAFGSWLILVLTAVLLRCRNHSPAPEGMVGERETLEPRWSLGIVGSTILLVLVWWMWQYGPNPIRVPWVQPTIDLDVHEGSVEHPIALDLGRGPFNTHYLGVRPTGAAPALLQVVGGSGLRIWIDGVETSRARIAERVTVAITNPSRAPRSTTLSLHLTRPTILEGETGEAEWAAPHGSHGWWKWRHSKEVQVFFDTEGSNFDTVLSVYRDGELVVKNDDIEDVEDWDVFTLGPKRTSRVGFKTDPTAVYEIVIEPFDEAARMPFGWLSKLRWQLGEPLPLLDLPSRAAGTPQQADVPAPDNDWVGAALALEGDRGQLAASNRGASTDTEELIEVDKSVWWVWTTPRDAVVTFDTRGSDFDTTLGVFRRLDGGWEPVAWNDDAGGAGGDSSRVRLVVDAGTEYFVGVGGFSGESGDIELSWSTRDLAGSDLFSEPAPFEWQNFASNRDASSSPGEPSHGGRPADRTLWWAWSVEEAGGVACLEAEAKGFSPVLAVYVGEDLAQLRTVASYDAAGNDQVLTCWRTEADVTYKIVVGSSDGKPGIVELSARFL